jgi:hypothetical protein
VLPIWRNSAILPHLQTSLSYFLAELARQIVVFTPAAALRIGPHFHGIGFAMGVN